MSQLFGIGLSGLGAARTGLANSGNNISNVNTPGYTRRTTTLVETPTASGAGGVTVAGTQRQYADFLSSQLDDARSTAAAGKSHLEQIGQIDELLAGDNASLAPRIQKLFDEFAALAADPESSAVRTSTLGAAESMAGRFRGFAEQMSNVGEQVDTRIDNALDRINDNTASIASLNKQIAARQAANPNNPPNNLLDQRDQLVSETAELIDVEVTHDANGDYRLSAGGQSLIDARGARELTRTHDPMNPDRPRLAIADAEGRPGALLGSAIRGGEVGGLIDFKNESLTPAEARLNQTAHVMARAVNTQHRANTDITGQPGTNLFSEQPPRVDASLDNVGDGEIQAAFVPGDSGSVTADRYIATADDNGALVFTRPGSTQPVAAEHDPETNNYRVGGMEISLSGTPSAGDRFTIRPLDNAAANLSVQIDDPGRLAAGRGGGTGDNRGARALADLQQADLVEGERSIADNYTMLAGNVGNKTESLKIAQDSNTAVVNELTQSQQSISGVNLDEESVNLMVYQQMYQANAKVIQTASSVFDSLLRLGG